MLFKMGPRVICAKVLEVSWGQGRRLRGHRGSTATFDRSSEAPQVIEGSKELRGMFSGRSWSRRQGTRGSQGIKGDISKIPWGHQGHLYAYIGDVHFLVGGRTHGQTSVG